MNDDTSFSLDRLLLWLAPDPLEAGRKYVEFHKELIEYVSSKGGRTVAEELTDEAFNRVAKRLSVFLLNEHFNSTEIGDVPHLCRILSGEGAKDSPSPSRRIRELLSTDVQSLVAVISQNGTFKLLERSRISKALNEILKRRDLYRAEDFNLPAMRVQAGKNSKIEKIETALTRGLPQLSQSEIEKFNRRLLEAAYPQTIKTNLADTPESEKLARCKQYAGKILLEYLKKPDIFKPPIREDGGTKPEDENRDTTSASPVDIGIEEEDEREKQERLSCQDFCKRKKLSPRDSEILDLYFTGIIIRSPDDEPLSEREIKAVRQKLAVKYGLSPETIRTVAHRCKLIIELCVDRCMKRQEKI